MLGHPLIGHVVLHKAGHDVMHGFVEKVLTSIDSYRFIELATPLQESIGAENLYLKAQLG